MRYIWALMVARRARMYRSGRPGVLPPSPGLYRPSFARQHHPIGAQGLHSTSEPDLVRSKSGYATPEGFLAGFRDILYQYESTKSMTYAGRR